MSQSDKRIVVLNLSDVDAIDGSGVGLLAFLQAWTRANHMELKLMNPARQVQEVLEITNLHSVLDTWYCEDLASLLSGVPSRAYVDEPQADRAVLP
jgi:anti-anti-sigma factor